MWIVMLCGLCAAVEFFYTLDNRSTCVDNLHSVTWRRRPDIRANSPATQFASLSSSTGEITPPSLSQYSLFDHRRCRLNKILVFENYTSLISSYIFRRTHSPNRLVWSEGWRPPGAQSAVIQWTGWSLAMTISWWQHHKHCRGYYYYYYYYYVSVMLMTFGLVFLSVLRVIGQYHSFPFVTSLTWRHNWRLDADV